MITKAISQHQRSKDATDLHHEARQYDVVESLCFHEQLGLLVGKLEMVHHPDHSPTAAAQKKREFSGCFVYEAK